MQTKGGVATRSHKYEFDRRTRREALLIADNKCSECGSDMKIELHHIASVHACRIVGVPHALISNLNNALALCHSCHKEVHRETKTEDFIQLAQALLGLQPALL